MGALEVHPARYYRLQHDDHSTNLFAGIRQVIRPFRGPSGPGPCRYSGTQAPGPQRRCPRVLDQSARERSPRDARLPLTCEPRRLRIPRISRTAPPPRQNLSGIPQVNRPQKPKRARNTWQVLGPRSSPIGDGGDRNSATAQLTALGATVQLSADVREQKRERGGGIRSGLHRPARIHHVGSKRGGGLSPRERIAAPRQPFNRVAKATAPVA